MEYGIHSILGGNNTVVTGTEYRRDPTNIFEPIAHCGKAFDDSLKALDAFS